MMGGAFMGAMMAQQGSGSGFDPARTYIVIDSVGYNSSDFYRGCTISTTIGCTIDWGDGTTNYVDSNYITHYYPSNSGPFVVEILGNPTSLGITCQTALAVSKINVGDSVTHIGSSSSDFNIASNSSTVEEVLGMRNVETISGLMTITSVKRFSFPPKVTTMAPPVPLNFRQLEEFSLGNVKYFDKDGSKSDIIATASKWILGNVERVDFRGVTLLSDRVDSVPRLSNNTNLKWVHWGSMKIFPSSSSTDYFGPFYGCTSLKQVLHDDGYGFSTPYNKDVFRPFGECTALEEMPIDISDPNSVEVATGKTFQGVYYGCPQLFPDHKATIAIEKFSFDSAAMCNVTDLTLDGSSSPTPVECRITVNSAIYYPGLKKLTIINAYSTATSVIIGGDFTNTLEEVIFPLHTTYAYAPRMLYQANNFANQLVVKYPTHTMDEVKNLVRYGRDVKDFPFGAPADTPVSKLYFRCSDGDMDVQGNVIQ